MDPGLRKHPSTLVIVTQRRRHPVRPAPAVQPAHCGPRRWPGAAGRGNRPRHQRALQALTAARAHHGRLPRDQQPGDSHPASCGV